MGSYGIPGETGTHAQIDRELMREWTDNGHVYSHTDCKLVGFNHHYSIYRIDGVPQCIELALITRYRECNTPGKERDSEWIYKPIDETMGPCEVDCPLSLLNAVQCPDSEYARKWREEVRKYHKQRTHAKGWPIRAGDVVTTTYGKQLTITRIHKRTLVYYSAEKGREFALPRKFIESVAFNFEKPVLRFEPGPCPTCKVPRTGIVRHTCPEWSKV